MSPLEKWIGLGALARFGAGRLLRRRVLPHLALAVSLAVMTGLLAAASLLIGFFAGYQTLLRHGLDPALALLIVAACAVLATVLCAVGTRRSLLRLKRALLPPLPSVPVPPRVKGIADAFMDGFRKPE